MHKQTALTVGYWLLTMLVVGVNLPVYVFQPSHFPVMSEYIAYASGALVSLLSIPLLVGASIIFFTRRPREKRGIHWSMQMKIQIMLAPIIVYNMLDAIFHILRNNS